jgi:hypothetical protein
VAWDAWRKDDWNRSAPDQGLGNATEQQLGQLRATP